MTAAQDGAAVPDPGRPDPAQPVPDQLSFLPIDPFAAHPQLASRVTGLGGDAAGDDPGYVFQSLDIYPVLGPNRFTLHFHGLSATSGTLTVHLRALSCHPALPPCPAPMPLHTLSVPMRDLVARGGILHVDLIGRRNMGCTIGGTIDDPTDARAAALSLSLDPRQRAAPPLPDGPVARVTPPALATSPAERADRPELAVVSAPQLARPVSQAMTAAQLRDPLVAAWNAALGQEGGAPAERWGNAIILQALCYYGIDLENARAVAIVNGRDRLASYLAGLGSSTLVAVTRRDDLPDADPGVALEHWHYPELCSPRRYFDSVHLTLFERLALPPMRDDFDFLWSVEAWHAAPDRFAPMVRGAMAWLRPRGVAVHLLPYAGTLDRPAHGRGLGRVEIERLALTLVADGHEVAQLDFALDPTPRGAAPVTPFALIARKQR
ncbi:hypothetical protein KZ813_07965 [Sphingomonas sp. RHCKR7]|uniref:hypothetical protein n=1 Tax=Sphingomonas folli TaxID=2862497 RepID=UPI001CA53693|nr:hypothetical protein [Sphingomonas folli]MBW6526770.1 hypothetical protein [Sphingomonas folli]